LSRLYARIFVPVDGSDVSTRAAREAVALARDQKAEVRFFHCFDMRKASREDVQEILDRAEALAERAGVKADEILMHCSTGNPSDAIVLEARRWNAGLIVMGTHSRGGLKRMVLGSVAEGVVRHASVPVLLVRQPTRGKILG